MKKVEANRYPHSATLFKFCKEALEIRYEGNVKVIDQDVGAILGYDPADCSHWKKGKKNIRALATLQSIANHLNIDERLLIDVASGRIGLEEAVFEFRGYGTFALNGKSLDILKKEFFRDPTKWQSDGGLRSFEELFDVNRPAVTEIANTVLEAGHFTEAPIYIPEVFQLYSNIKLINNEAASQTIEIKQEESSTTIVYRGPEMRPFMRFLIAKELFKHLSRTQNPITSQVQKVPEEVLDIQANIFAGILLIPGNLLRKEVEKIDTSLDIVMQLADIFWTSRSLMNHRLRDYLEHSS